MSNNKLRPKEKQVLKKGYVTFTRLHDKRDVSVNSSNFSPLAVDLEGWNW